MIERDMQSVRITMPRMDCILLCLILLLGTGIRGAYFTELMASPEYLIPQKDQVDLAFYDNYARDIAEKTRNLIGLTPARAEYHPEVNWNQPPNHSYIRPPGYTHFLALVYTFTNYSHAALRLIQMALGVLSALLAFRLARLLLGNGGVARATALITAGLMATYWIFIVYEGVVHHPSLIIFLTLLTLNAFMGWRRKPAWSRAAGCGISLGLLALTSPGTVLMIPVAAAWMLWVLWRAGSLAVPACLRSVCPMLLAVAGVISPVTIANYIVGKKFVLIAVGGAIMLMLGNHETSDGTFVWPEQIFGGPFVGNDDVQMKTFLEKSGLPADYPTYTKFARDKFMGYLKEDPERLAKLTAKRAFLFWTPKEISHAITEPGYHAFSRVLRWLPANFGFLLGAAVAGLCLWCASLWRRREDDQNYGARLDGLLIVSAFLGIYYLPYTLFYITAIYRAPLLPLLILLAAYSVSRAAAAIKQHDWRTASCLLPGVAVYAITCFVPVDYSKDVDRWLFYRTQYHLERGDVAGALVQVENAVACQPRCAAAHLLRGDILTRLGRESEASAAYQLAAQTDPASATGLLRLAKIDLDAGNLTRAEDSYRRVLAAAPKNAEALAGLGQLREKAGARDEASALYRDAINADPSAYVPCDCMDALLRGESPEAALEFWRGTAETHDNSARAWYYLGQAFMRGGQPDKACDALQKAAKLAATDPAHWMALAESAVATQNWTIAREALRNALGINPEIARAKELQTQLPPE